MADFTKSDFFSLLGLGTSVGASIAQVQAGKIKKIGYDTQAKAKEIDKKQAELNADLKNMYLMREFNDIQANNAVMMAVSGRSFDSRSFQNMRRADQEQLNWDMEFNKKTADVEIDMINAEQIGLRGAGEIAKRTGKTEGLFTTSKALFSYARIK